MKLTIGNTPISESKTYFPRNLKGDISIDFTFRDRKTMYTVIMWKENTNENVLVKNSSSIFEGESYLQYLHSNITFENPGEIKKEFISPDPLQNSGASMYILAIYTQDWKLKGSPSKRLGFNNITYALEHQLKMIESISFFAEHESITSDNYHTEHEQYFSNTTGHKFFPTVQYHSEIYHPEIYHPEIYHPDIHDDIYHPDMHDDGHILGHGNIGEHIEYY